MTRGQYLAKRSGLLAIAKGHMESGDLEAFAKAKKDVEDLDAAYEAESTARANFAALQGSAVVPAQLQNLSNPAEVNPAAPVADRYDSAEYKNAFMNFVCRGESIPAAYRSNAAASTAASDVGAVIPTTTLREIIRSLKERGIIFQSMRRMNVQGGVEIPILDLYPTASWVGEGASEDQKMSAKGSISFKYYGLECKLSQSILVSVVTFEEFQSLFVELATEAVITTIEKGAFSGTGTNQMLGVTADPRVTNVVEMTESEFTSYSAWKKKVFAKIPLRYQTGKFYMSLGTFEGCIDGMVDSNGQPIGRVNYGIAEETRRRFGGKDVQPVEADVLPDFDTASSGDVVAVYMNMKDYVFNSNMTMTVVRWTDNDANKEKIKVLLICDGKAADTNGIFLIKKKVASGT